MNDESILSRLDANGDTAPRVSLAGAAGAYRRAVALGRSDLEPLLRRVEDSPSR